MTPKPPVLLPAPEQVVADLQGKLAPAVAIRYMREFNTGHFEAEQPYGDDWNLVRVLAAALVYARGLVTALPSVAKGDESAAWREAVVRTMYQDLIHHFLSAFTFASGESAA
jgi:hypothetical protein